MDASLRNFRLPLCAHLCSSVGDLRALTANHLTQLQQRLLAWYAQHKRALPWRGTRDPYRIWLSEVMLQQTRVAAVVDYYRRFLARFPTVHALACARNDEVMRLWAGLGYYSRARNLHAAAKQVVRLHRGRFPRDYASIRALPGVGDYTAAAIASIGFGEPRAVLDGNVARVLARLYALRGSLRAPRRWKQLQRLAQSLMPAGAGRPAAGSPGDWNQAMMELGATVCTPRAPACAVCPASNFCAARRLEIVDEVPEVRSKRAPVELHLVALALVDARGRALMVREQNEYFSRMWQFPAVVTKKPRHSVAAVLARTYAAEGASGAAAAAPVRHTVTFRHLTIHPYVVRRTKVHAGSSTRLVALNKLDSLPVSSATRKVAASVARQLRRQPPAAK